MKNLLLNAGYQHEPDTNIWVKPGYASIAYNDGDEVEQRIANIISRATDLSVLSTELRQHCTDWPSLYHFSSSRANILRPLAHTLSGADVLEIGAGCGAITRYLGEIGSKVIALEGSQRRAAIARARTRDLNNVEVVADRFNEFSCEQKFDVVTLIGVLEYANLFTPSDTPAQTMLKHICSLLKPWGCIVIAIENQLGLKYFAGAPEDHLGQPMYGIEGRYGKGQTQTYGRHVLGNILRQSGFEHFTFMATFPDYKIPVSIVTEAGFSAHDFDASAFAWQSTRRDPQLGQLLSFSPELAWPEIFKNKMALDVANSFLIIASPNAQELINRDILAFHYSTDRIPQFCKETRFVASGSQIDVVYQRLGMTDEHRGANENTVVDFSCPVSVRYSKGTVFAWEFVRTVTQDGWTIEEVGVLLKRYISALAILMNRTESASPLATADTLLPGRFFDSIPQNIIIRKDGTPENIDAEWTYYCDIELGYLLFRALLCVVGFVTKFGNNATQRNLTRIGFIEAAFKQVGFVMTKQDWSRFIKIESIVQEQVSGQPANPLFSWWLDQPIPLVNFNQAVTERDGQIVGLNQTVTERDGQIVGLNQTVTERDGQIVGLNQTVTERDGQIVNLNQAAAEREGQIVNLNQAVTERNGQIVNLNQAVTERNGQIVNLNQAVTERNGQINSLNQAVAERNGQINSLNQAVAERDGQIAGRNKTVTERDGQLTKIISSESWRITRPLRFLGRLARGCPLHISACVDDTCPNMAPTHPVSVILPVYRDAQMTKACILSAISGVVSVPKAKLIVINDASPDTEMRSMLAEVSAQWPHIIELMNNERNLGFVTTVNSGIKRCINQDIVLLNSDVITPHDWLRRLIDEAYSRPNVATVTPLSNSTTICTFPDFLQDNPLPFSLDVDSVDAAFRDARFPCVEAPTGVGFCMYIRHACIEKIGCFDEERFGRGYGEENDFCQRAIKAGFVNLITPNIYVFHKGGVSFGAEKGALVEGAMRVIDELHPNYHADVQAFIAADPHRPARIYRHIKMLSMAPVPKILHVSHGLGGGVDQHIEELGDCISERAASLVLMPHGNGDRIKLQFGARKNTDSFCFNVPEQYEELLDVLQKIGVSRVHFHHVINVHKKLLDLPKDLRVEHILTIHDFYLLNGNPSITNEHFVYPGYYHDELHNDLYPPPKGLTVEQWRVQFRPLVERAKFVIFPSVSTQLIFGDVFRIHKKIVAYHPEEHRHTKISPRKFRRNDRYNICVLGAIGQEKGADFLEAIAKHASQVEIPIDFLLIGYTYRSLEMVKTTGPYHPNQLVRLIDEHQSDIIFFPARWPETYSYTLSYALQTGLPIVAPNIGAFPERLEKRQNVMLFDHLMSAPNLMDQLVTFIKNLEGNIACYAPNFVGERAKQSFYDDDYLLDCAPQTITKKSMEMAQSTVIELCRKSGSNRTVSLRKKILLAMWRAYQVPALRIIANKIPYTMRRSVKRILSRAPIHDL